MRAQRLESLSLLAAGLSHDLRNILQPLLIMPDLLKARTEDPQLHHLADVIAEGGRRGHEMAESMLSFVRGSRKPSERIEIDGLLDAVALLLRSNVPDAVRLELQVQDDGLVGDAKLALEALGTEVQARLAHRNSDAVDGAVLAGRAKAARLAQLEPLANSLDAPIRPERVVQSLNRLLPDDAVVCADPGTPCPYFSAYYDVSRPGRHFITNRAHGALGFSMSAALGAWVGRPQSKCVSVMGDGSFGFTVGELETIVRHKAPLLMIVFSNSVYGWIKASQKAGYDQRYYSVDFNRTDHARIAEAYGVKAWRVEDPSKLDAAIKAAMEHDGPALIDVVAQPLQDAAAPVSQWMG
ncbi:hypothetical protein G6F68_009594 [Rhizopus microsporus]|nr:hypothetical protein G6F68_009594 [Rhizopus microsporus]